MKINKLTNLALSVVTAVSLTTLTSCDPMKSAKDAARTGSEIKTYNQKTMESMKVGASKEARDNAYDKALAEENFIAKTVHTATYFNAMSYQLLGVMEENSIDLEYNREKLKADSVKEFVKTMTSLIPSNYEFKEPNALRHGNKNQTLNAFAVAMHEINLSQYNNLKGQKNPALQIESFFDVLAKSRLTLLHKDLAGEMSRSELTLDDKEILREHNKIVYMLKLRYKALFVVALGRMSYITRYEDRSTGIVNWNWFKDLIQKVDMRYFSWSPKPMGTEETEYVNDIFARANTTKALLDKIGEDVEVDKDIKEIFNHMVWPAESINTTHGGVDYLKAAQNKLKDNLESIK